MLGHVTLSALDAERAALHSPAIIDGLLITDDLNMGAVYSKGIGSVAGEALAAGHQTIYCGQQEKTAKNQICPAPSTLAQFGGMPARL